MSLDTYHVLEKGYMTLHNESYNAETAGKFTVKTEA